MIELLTAQQMRDHERAAINSGVVTGLELMERAGQGVVSALMDHMPTLAKKPSHALVLCGPGNNGGDGFVIARLLSKIGFSVDLYLFGDPEKLPPDARTNHDRWAHGHAVHPWDPDAILVGKKPDVVVDAVFGIGLTRALPQIVASVLDASREKGRKREDRVFRVAVDCPSGLNLDTGYIAATPFDADDHSPKSQIYADLTVTFHSPKPGHYLGRGPDHCGALCVVDIGLGRAGVGSNPAGTATEKEEAHLTLIDRVENATAKNAVDANWPLSLLPKMRGGAHKYDFGHVIVFAGGVGTGGAGRMAARAALRSGAGLVTLVCPKAAILENATHLNAIMLRGLDDPMELNSVADARVSAFCVGPGLGVGSKTKALVGEVLARQTENEAGRNPAVILDADALTSFADAPEVLFEHTHCRTILTPHQGEFRRLFPDLAELERRGCSKVDVVREAARRAGCVVLLKGRDTVIADPNGRARLHAAAYDRAVPWLATAGAGDVLAGLIAGLAAAPASADLTVAAEAAVWLHVECALSFGPGLIAEDLPEELPKVMRSLVG